MTVFDPESVLPASVLAQITEARVRTRISPAPGLGAGTSLTASLPERALCMTCFICPFYPLFKALCKAPA